MFNRNIDNVEFKFDDETQAVIDEANKRIEEIKQDVESRFVNSATAINRFCRDKRNEKALREEIEMRTKPYLDIIENAVMIGNRIMIVHKKEGKENG